MTDIPHQAGETVRTFFDALKEQPLSLALVVMNFVLLGYLFYNGTQLLKLRNDTTALIVEWQRESDKLMASCVSQDIMKLVLDNLESMRKKVDGASSTPLPTPAPPPNPPPVPQTWPDPPANSVVPMRPKNINR